MTVSELIAELEKLDGSKKVLRGYSPKVSEVCEVVESNYCGDDVIVLL